MMREPAQPPTLTTHMPVEPDGNEECFLVIFLKTFPTSSHYFKQKLLFSGYKFLHLVEKNNHWKMLIPTGPSLKCLKGSYYTCGEVVTLLNNSAS